MNKPLLGFCPIGKFVFSHEDALKYKRAVQRKMDSMGVNYTGIDGVLKDGIVRKVEDVEKAVKYFSSKQIDAIFMPHCNFGTEHAVGLIGRDAGVPALLWGPRDERPLPNGTRLRDSLCGLLASSKVLHKLGAPFTYIENCRVEDKIFEQGLTDFLRTAAIVKGFRKIRIGQIGQRIDFFWTTIVNESELLEKFGIEVLPIDMVELIKEVKLRAEKDKTRYSREIRQLKKEVKFDGFKSETPVRNLLALRDVVIEKARKHNLTGFAVQSFMSVCDELGAMVEFPMAEVSDAGYPVACETDIHGAVSSIILQKASFDSEPVFFADFTIRHPENDNAILLWHCGFPRSLKAEGGEAKVGTHWILPGIPPGSCHWRLKEGEITVCRFDGDAGKYEIAVGKGKTIQGPETLNTYVWMEVDDWPRWERQLIEGPYIHHTAAIYGDFTAPVIEACKYIGVKPTVLGNN